MASELHSNGHAFRSGLKAELPVAISVIPFGIIFGVLARSAGLPPLAAQAMSAIVFAGSAQFIGVQLIGSATPGAVVVLTTAIVNLRHLLYGADMAPRWQALRWPWRIVLAYLMTDEAYAVYAQHHPHVADNGRFHHYFFLALGLSLWTAWQLSTAVGIFVGAALPAGWGLDFTLALTFIALVAPTLNNRPTLVAALSAVAVALLTAGWPYRLGLLCAALTGIAAGVLAERRT